MIYLCNTCQPAAQCIWSKYKKIICMLRHWTAPWFCYLTSDIDSFQCLSMFWLTMPFNSYAYAPQCSAFLYPSMLCLSTMSLNAHAHVPQWSIWPCPSMLCLTMPLNVMPLYVLSSPALPLSGFIDLHYYAYAPGCSTCPGIGLRVATQFISFHWVCFMLL